MDTRSVTIITYNISFSLYTFRDISSAFMLQAQGRGMGKHPYMLCTVDVFMIIGPGLFDFGNFRICFSSFVLLHSDARAKLKPNHDVNDGFGMSCFEPSHFTESKCGRGMIVWRSPLRGCHVFFS